jgi:hypothetical protein
VPTLLPATERVFFMGGDPKEPELLASASWDRVQNVVGHLLTAQDCYPPRYFVTEFPSSRQLAELGNDGQLKM